jgi:DNA-directed RNA polymerase alpha subunit/DNA-directed RNA polymerase subunit L|tara:strand:- start:4625 stop:5893 length:1269 start_codon:yes stop_codon:yes gene_type:complete
MTQNPELTASILENDECYKFTLKNIHTSTANAIRRTILSDIPIHAFRTESEEVNTCKILTNTTRFHNEIIKQRLSCIPIHYRIEKDKITSIDKWKEPWDTPSPTSMLDEENGVGLFRYELELDVSNDEEHQLKWVTTEDFQLKDRETGKYLAREEVRKIFPPNGKTQRYIDFLRLRPSIGPTIPGEQIKLIARFSTCTAKVNGMFNAVSVCTYQNKIDIAKRDSEWEKQLKIMQSKDDFETKTEEDKRFEKENFLQLQGQRYFVANQKGEPIEFEFTIQSIGIYEPSDIVQMSCDILMDKFKLMIQNIDSDLQKVIPSDKIRDSGEFLTVTESTIPNGYDIVLENEDYTIGCVLERILYDMFFEGEKIMTFVGFKKYHPHDSYSIVRIAYKEDVPTLTRNVHLKKAAAYAVEIFQKIRMKIV